jgi:hypothetical protein
MISNLLMKSRVTEVDNSFTRINGAYQNTTLNSDPNLMKIFGPLQEKSTLLAGAIRRLKTQSAQQPNDEVRDEKIDALYYLLLSFSHHPDEAVRNAALRLLEIFGQYGLEMKDESYATESSLVNSLVNDYANRDREADIALVPQCAEYIAALKAAQANFDGNRVAFEEARAEEGTLENASALKKAMVVLINNQLVPYLNVMAQLDEPAYGAFARTVAEIIAENNEVVKKRRQNEEPEEEPEGTE